MFTTGLFKECIPKQQEALKRLFAENAPSRKELDCHQAFGLQNFAYNVCVMVNHGVHGGVLSRSQTKLCAQDADSR